MPRPPPKPCLASAESAKTAAARISAAPIETLFNMLNPPSDEFRQLFNSNEIALIPSLLVDLGPTLLNLT
jgi:hypothetical protein